MQSRTIIILLITHLIVAAGGFAAGIYTLPILIAPPAPTANEVRSMSAQASFTGEFIRDLADSDSLHWGEGIVSIGDTFISFEGELAPGPDYKLYLAPEFVETESHFERIKADMIQVGDVKTFDNFIVNLPETVDPEMFNTVIIWCESFAEFITAAKYR